MADVITDNRTLISTMDANTNVVDEAGAAYAGQNTETFIEGTASQSVKQSASAGGIFYDYTTPQDFSGTHFYIWWACATAGKLQTRAAGGVRIRFCGATVTDWFEIYIAGADTYTGGFLMSVTDIVTARANAVAGTLGGVNGTTPAVSAIQYVGVFFDMNGMVSGNVDNCFVDAMWYLPAATPGVIVEGRNGGATNWTWDDIRNASDNNDPTKAWGVFKDAANGTYSCNTPIQFGVNDATTHGFTDSNQTIGFEDQLVAADFYGLTVIGGSGAQSFTMGVVSGTGVDRVGTQGCTITAGAAFARWFFDADDANLDACNLYGCTFQHGANFQLDNAGVNVIGSTWLDCTSATVTGADVLGCLIVDANTADDVAFMVTADLGDIVSTSFVFSDGHAIEVTANTVDPQTLTGCTFTGYGADASTDAAVYYTYTGTLAVNITDGALPTKKDAGTATTTQTASVPVSVTVQEQDTTKIENCQVSIYLSADDSEVLNLDTTALGVAAGSFSGSTPAAVYWRARKSSPADTKYKKQSGLGTITTAGFAITVTLSLNPINNA